MQLLEENHDYNFPGVEFTPDQVDAIEFALTKFNCIIGLQPGLGKTLVSLRVAYQILARTKKTVCFVVCPKEANTAFKKELKKKFRLPFSIQTTEEKEFNPKSRFIIFNYSNLALLEEYTIRCRNAGYKIILIADEVHVMNSFSSNMSKKLRALRPNFACVVGLTGTPILNAVEGIWGIVDFVCPGYLGRYNDFRYRYVKYKRRTIRVTGGRTRQIEEPQGIQNVEELSSRLGGVIITRRLTYDVEFVYKSCSLTDDEKEQYEKAAKGIIESEDDEKAMSARLHDLQRIADGSHHLMEGNYTYSKAKLLVSSVREIMQRGEGVLIYTEYEDTYKALGDVIEKYRGMIGYKNLYFITGKVTYKKRVEVEQYLKAGDVVVLTKAGCRSINLQAVNNIIVYDIPFSVGDLVQLIGRVTRVDTKYPKQFVYFLEANETIDTYKRLLIQSHSTIIQAIFGEDKNLPYFGDVDEDIMMKYRTYFKRKLLWCK